MPRINFQKSVIFAKKKYIHFLPQNEEIVQILLSEAVFTSVISLLNWLSWFNKNLRVGHFHPFMGLLLFIFPSTACNNCIIFRQHKNSTVGQNNIKVILILIMSSKKKYFNGPYLFSHAKSPIWLRSILQIWKGDTGSCTSVGIWGWALILNNTKKYYNSTWYMYRYL